MSVRISVGKGVKVIDIEANGPEDLISGENGGVTQQVVATLPSSDLCHWER